MPRTIRNLYDKFLSIENLEKAHKKSSKGKGLKRDVILFNLNKEEYIKWLYNKLRDNTYTHGGYKIFYITEPQKRKIEASRYIDRIVHRWIVDSFLEKYFVTSYINTTYACIKGRGMHKAVLDVQKAMKHCQRTWNEYYILKMDITQYFASIDKSKLYEIISKKVQDENIVILLKKIIYSNKGEKGIAIGNYTSQVFANIYLNELDQYIKHKLRCKYYYRYMDDSVIIIKTKEEAKHLLYKITNYLEKELYLELNSKTQIFKSKQGVNFCGYKVNEYRLKIRDKGKRKLKKKIKQLKYEIKNGNITNKEAKKYLCGHIGYIKCANVKNLTDKLFYKSK